MITQLARNEKAAKQQAEQGIRLRILMRSTATGERGPGDFTESGDVEDTGNGRQGGGTADSQ